jgi:hypothetical protein
MDALSRQISALFFWQEVDGVQAANSQFPSMTHAGTLTQHPSSMS